VLCAYFIVYGIIIQRTRREFFEFEESPFKKKKKSKDREGGRTEEKKKNDGKSRERGTQVEETNQQTSQK